MLCVYINTEHSWRWCAGQTLRTHTQADCLLIRQISSQFFQNSISMWTLQQEGGTCRTVFTQTSLVHTTRNPADDPNMQTECQMCQAHLKAHKDRPPRANSALQEYIKCTDWDIVREAANYGGSIRSAWSVSVTGSMNDIAVQKTITKCPNLSCGWLLLVFCQHFVHSSLMWCGVLFLLLSCTMALKEFCLISLCTVWAKWE